MIKAMMLTGLAVVFASTVMAASTGKAPAAAVKVEAGKDKQRLEAAPGGANASSNSSSNNVKFVEAYVTKLKSKISAGLQGKLASTLRELTNEKDAATKEQAASNLLSVLEKTNKKIEDGKTPDQALLDSVEEVMGKEKAQDFKEKCV